MTEQWVVVDPCGMPWGATNANTEIGAIGFFERSQTVSETWEHFYKPRGWDCIRVKMTEVNNEES